MSPEEARARLRQHLASLNPPARDVDPVTSHRTAAWRPRRDAVSYRMLIAHGNALFAPGLYVGFTNDEIARAIGMSPTNRCCPWHRHGDLEEKLDEQGGNRSGYLRVMLNDHGQPVTRPGETGEDQVVRVLTPEGVALYRDLTGVIS
jgi:hypothetical protein